MRIYAIDDEPDMLELMHREIQKAAPDAEIRDYSHPGELLTAAKETPCDAAFLDIRMPDMDGMELAEALKHLNPKVNIIFVTGYSEYKANAFDLRASGYIMKPVSAMDVREELRHLRFHVGAEKRVRFRCFGRFEALIDGKPVRFRRSKTLEVLAYLVDCRSMCSTQEIMAALWEDEKSGSYVRNLRKDLLDTFAAAGCEDIFFQQWDKLGIDASRVSCDYYDWIAGNSTAQEEFWGEYMHQYEWAEFTRRKLEERKLRES